MRGGALEAAGAPAGSPARKELTPPRGVQRLSVGGLDLRSARRSQHGDDPRMAVDLRLVDDLDVSDAGDARQPTQALDGKAPVDEVVARVHIAGVGDVQ